MSTPKDMENENVYKHPETKIVDSKYGTHHVLVLADFSSRSRTSDLEKIFEDFRDCGVVIHWVNDTTALAVFRTPSIGTLETVKHVCFPFTIRILDEDDMLLGSISTRDVEPPHQRPQTSARTVQRLIAQAMGSKFAVLNRGV